MSVPSAEAVAEKIPNSPLESSHSGPDLGEESKKTTHMILKNFDAQKRGIEILHRDLFDSNSQVVCSALRALGTMKDPRSLKLIGRLLTSPDEEIQYAAVRTIGEIGHPKTEKVLFDLYKICKSERLRLVILEAIAKIVPQEPNTLLRIEEYACSKLAKQETRVSATSLLLKIKSDVDVMGILSNAKEDIIEAVYTLAAEKQQIAAQVVQHGATRYQRLTASNRSLLLSLAAKSSRPEAIGIMREGLRDVDPVVRHQAYSLLGESSTQAEICASLIQYLSEQVDPDLNLEEEALLGIGRLEKIVSGPVSLSIDAKKKIYDAIEKQFKVLSTPGRRIGSDSHELGWLIARSKEYVEYYADKDFQQALLHYLKGSSYYTQDKILADLKASAVKIEVRHFDGYRALVDIINTPKRAGIGLIARELAITKLGKRKPFYSLIRNLRLTRLIDTAGLRVDAVSTFLQIFSWAMKAKLFRLAEAALYALTRMDVKKATDACLECLAPPVFSKICAIGAIHLLQELDWGVMEPAVRKLLSSSEDPHILLNLVDALANAGLPLSGEIVKSMVTILCSGKDQEVVHRVADFLGSQSTFNIFESIIEGFERAESWRQRLVLSILERKILERRVSNREGLIEFLYKILRSEGSAHQSKAAVLLWRLGDDYAAKVLKEFLINSEAEERIAILRSLSGALNADIVPSLLPLLRSEHPGVQEALQESFSSVEEEDVRNRICELAFAVRGEGSPENELHEEAADVEVQVDFFKEKKAYRFEHEYIQELAVLFTDIQGYSKKAQVLTTMQLSALIQDYEGILLPTLINHRGELIKKMGEGHLVVFLNALDSVLAAIRIQKALKRFNSYREQEQRVVIRIGIHWGKIVRKEGDVLGNHVNIASRLESSAKGGSILISETLHQRLGAHIHARELGLISVKGISEPIKVFEPYEIVLDFPAELDPLKNKQTSHTQSRENQIIEETVEGVPGNEDGRLQAPSLDRKTLKAIAETFSSLNALCRKAEAKQIEVTEIRKELVSRWRKIQLVLGEGR
ncbi:MAG: HEAT repeat domain-containing protein [Spirochaetia bacterium]